MKGAFYSHKRHIGEINFSNMTKDKTLTQIGMGGIWGCFSPNEDYELIRKEIQIWNFEQNGDFAKWHSFKFNIQLENGYFVLPEGGYMVDDFEDYPEESLVVRAVGIHSHIFSDYFIQKKPFLNDTWRKITIEEKFFFEEKYRKETSLVKKLTFFLENLREPIFSALAINKNTEEILYATSGTNKRYFAIVNFINLDEERNPKFKFYNIFDEFLKPGIDILS